MSRGRGLWEARRRSSGEKTDDTGEGGAEAPKKK